MNLLQTINVGKNYSTSVINLEAQYLSSSEQFINLEYVHTLELWRIKHIRFL